MNYIFLSVFDKIIAMIPSVLITLSERKQSALKEMVLMTRKELLQWMDSQAETTVNLWRELVRLESPSASKAAIDELARHLESYLQGMGLSVQLHDFPKAGMALTAWTEESKLAPVLLMGHYDTVHPMGFFGEDPFVIDENGLVHGPGVYDMKGGIAAAILVIRALQHFGYNKRQIRLAFIGDEEVAHEYSELESVSVFHEGRNAVAAFNMESGALNGDIVTGRKGGLVAKIVVHGVSAHAGREPQNGASAICEAARKVLKIEALTDYSGTTYNCGKIEGGVGDNTVPDTCSILLSVRFRENSGYEEAVQALRSITADNADPRVTAEFTELALFNAMEKTEKTDALFARYQRACEELGFRTPEQMYTGGCSDAAYTAMAGIPTLCGAGVRGEYNHTLKEYAVVSSVVDQAKKILLTILDLPDDF